MHGTTLPVSFHTQLDAQYTVTSYHSFICEFIKYSDFLSVTSATEHALLT